MQYAGKATERAQSSVVHVCFGFTKSVLMSQVDPDFRCKRCLGTAQAIDGRLCTEVQLDAVDNFVYLDDCICPGGGFELATIKRCHSALGRLENSCPCLLVKQFL